MNAPRFRALLRAWPGCSRPLAKFVGPAILACAGALASVSAQPCAADAARFRDVAAVIQARCAPCHDSDTRSGGIDLTILLEEDDAASPKRADLWIKLEGMIADGRMPPEGESPLEPADKDAVLNWFRASFILRQGEPHIGPTPLRRLTRFELENTLQDVLAIQLRAPYRDTITGQIERSPIEATVPSDIPGASGFDNDAHRMSRLKPPLQEIAQAVHDALAKFDADPVAWRTVLGREDWPANANANANANADADAVKDDPVKDVLERFLRRAYRGNRPGLSESTAAYSKLYREQLRESRDGRQSLLHVLEMILVSPPFLYRLEDSQSLDRPYPVSGLELATRLSYFLWSTTPDDELLRLGQDGSLQQDAVLKAQVARMLDSPKRIALSERFAGQWLGFDDLLSNGEYFLNERWNRESYDEALFFFDELIKADRTVWELVQSDWIYKRSSALNDGGHGYVRMDPASVTRRFADILSVRKSKSRDPQVRYEPPVLVQSNNDREGGIITTPAIMRLTASKDRTSPIRRGVWVLSAIMGRRLEPPPNVPSLDQARETLRLKANPTVAEVIRQHVSKPECISCHKAIDPLGLGLENFSPTGAWRTHYPDQAPVASAGTMPDGKRFDSPRELKRLLLESYRDEISENFVRQLFAYALGRKLAPCDRVSLEAILRQVKTEGYKVNTVIEQIVLSQQFRCRQDR